MTPLLVGEAPSRNGDPNTPLEGRIGERISALAGISFEEYLRTFDRMNLVDAWPGTNGKGSKFPAERLVGSSNWQIVCDALGAGRTVLLLGKRVAKVFQIDDYDYFVDVTMFDAGRAVVVPHPSGINRWYNEPENLALASRFFRGML